MTHADRQLEVLNTHKKFGEFKVLEDVSLAVDAGSLCGLIGPNGAGKSTLFAVVSGIESATAGTIRLDGTNISRLSTVERARSGMARTFQVPREFRNLTVRENLSVAALRQSGDSLLNVFFRPGRVAAQEDAIRVEVDRVVAFLGLDRVRDEAAGRLSGGQKKLLEFGRAMMLRPRLILLDEPFAGVNPVMIEQLSTHIRTLQEQGVSFLIVEHNIPALSSLVETMYVMDRGRIIANGHPHAVLSDERVRTSYLGSMTAECC
jgi:branched-chain amino acid transport system ATP-binding protein